MRGLRTASLAIVVMALAGCAIAPGMTMTEPAELPEGPVVRVTPVTLDLVFENMGRYLAGEPLVNVVRPELGY